MFEASKQVRLIKWLFVFAVRPILTSVSRRDATVASLVAQAPSDGPGDTRAQENSEHGFSKEPTSTQYRSNSFAVLAAASDGESHSLLSPNRDIETAPEDDRDPFRLCSTCLLDRGSATHCNVR